MTKRIIIVEDDQKLVAEATPLLIVRGYQPFHTKLAETNTLKYWQQVNPTPTDLVVMDLNFKLAGMSFSGLTVLNLLNREKQRGQLCGLEQVLVATSLKQQLNSPGICLDLTAYRVYGLEKAMGPNNQVVGSYAHSLVDTIDQIYAGKAKQLNTVMLKKSI